MGEIAGIGEGQAPMVRAVCMWWLAAHWLDGCQTYGRTHTHTHIDVFAVIVRCLSSAFTLSRPRLPV